MNAQFTVPGEPVGKGRPRISTVHGFVMTFSPEKTVDFETMVAWEFRHQCRDAWFEQGVHVGIRVDAYMGIPKSAARKKRQLMLTGEIRPAKKPDASNILKAVEDGLNGVAYHDDAQIVEAEVRKYYSDDPRTEITLWRVDG